MIENMSLAVGNDITTNNNSNHNNNNTHTQNNNNNNNNNNSNETNTTINVQGQCEFNFLKRELDHKSSVQQHPPPQHQQQQQQQHEQQCEINTSNNVMPNIPLDQYEPHNMQPPWKKRHIEHHDEALHPTTTATTPTTTATNTNCFDLNNFTTHTLHDFQCAEQDIAATTCVTTATTTTPNHNSNDLTFNLIGNSSFINDLFGYDANLLVPVPANLVATTNYHATATTSDATYSSTLATASATSEVANSYAAAAPVDVADDVANWHSNDLLDLDHRYNSNLQADLTELSSVMSMKSNVTSGTTSHSNTRAITAQQQANGNEFLVPSTHAQSTYHNTPTLKQRLEQPVQFANHQQQQQQQTQHLHTDAEADLEDKNLSWLLNFKFDEFPHLSPDLGGGQHQTHHATQQSSPTTSLSSQHSSPHKSHQTANSHSSGGGGGGGRNAFNAGKGERSTSPKSSTNAGKRFKELVMEVTSEVDGNEMVVAENITIEESSFKAPKKPPFTYTELIEYALEDKGELTVSGIYQWISDRFPYYKSNDDRWKNSVRHNLSINPHFRKGHKAPQGAGHLWTISSGDSAENVLAWEHKKQRLDLFFKMESMNRERIQKHQQQLQQQHLQEQHAQHCTSPQQHEHCAHQEQCLYDETAVAAAAITQEMLQTKSSDCHGGNVSVSSTTNASIELPYHDILNDEELRKTAGQILNGIHRDVEVQAVNSIISTYQDVLLDNEDYLNPIHKDVAVSESGLRHCALHLHNSSHHTHNSSNNSSNTHLHSQYYVTDIDPMELGIQMSHQVEATDEEEVLFNDDFNLNYFSYNPGNDIVA